MSITEKYGFQVSINQFHQPVDKNWWDESEQLLINCFEQACLELKQTNRCNYAMIELGSNQCYYSLLFKHILGKRNTTNIMVEPYKPHFEAGKTQFELNRCNGRFYNNSIGKLWAAYQTTFDVEPIMLNKILQEQGISKVDIIQCDIDGSEQCMLDTNLNFFINKRTKYLFLATHSTELHNYCKTFLENVDYKVIMDHPYNDVGGDMLIIAQC